MTQGFPQARGRRGREPLFVHASHLGPARCLHLVLRSQFPSTSTRFLLDSIPFGCDLGSFPIHSSFRLTQFPLSPVHLQVPFLFCSMHIRAGTGGCCAPSVLGAWGGRVWDPTPPCGRVSPRGGPCRAWRPRDPDPRARHRPSVIHGGSPSASMEAVSVGGAPRIKASLG